MSNPLAIYLHDHLAGSRFAIELLKLLQEEYRDHPLGEFACGLEAEVTADQETLQTVIDIVGEANIDLKGAAGWFAEKAAQSKVKEDHAQAGIGTFEALEALVLGIRGKLALWQVLPLAREVDPRIPNLDFAKLAASAEDQGARVEKQRLHLAPTTFRTQA